MAASVTIQSYRAVLLALILPALVAGGCASGVGNLSDDMRSAGKKCVNHNYDTELDLVKCFDLFQRAVVEKNAPNLVPAYDRWNESRGIVAADRDRKILIATQSAKVALDVVFSQNNRENDSKFAQFLPQSGEAIAALRREFGNAVASACQRDGKYNSPSMVINYTCERDAKMPIIERNFPAAVGIERNYWDRMLEAAAVYDKAALQIIQDANLEMAPALRPATATFMSSVQEAIDEDAEKTARQTEEVENILSAIIQDRLLLSEQLRKYDLDRAKGPRRILDTPIALLLVVH